MVISHSSYKVGASALKGKIMKVKKDIYKNEAGECKETSGGLPKGWAKGKLVAKKGQEMSDAEFKALNIKNKVEKKAVDLKENKAK